MRLTRTMTGLDRLRSALDDAKADRTRLQSKAATLDAAERELAELSADEYLGTISPAEFERRRAEIEARRRDAQERLARQRTIVETLARRCVEEAEREGRERLDALADEIADHTARAAEHHRRAAEEEQAAEQARERLAAAEIETAAEVAAFLADFDPSRAHVASSAEAQRKESARWWAQKKPNSPGEWPPSMAPAIREEIENLRERVEAENAQLREASDRNLRDFGFSESERAWARSGRPVNG